MSDSQHLEGGSDTRAGGRMYTEVNRVTAQFNLNLFHSGSREAADFRSLQDGLRLLRRAPNVEFTPPNPAWLSSL